jgi:C1A family cysteine protease
VLLMAFDCRDRGAHHVLLDQRARRAIRSAPTVAPTLDSLVPGAVLPASFDLRTEGRVTGVQVPACAVCWATAAIASLESSLLPFESWDFSEDQLQRASGLACGAGGHYLVSASTLTAWRAPVRESDYDYTALYPDGHPEVVKHVQRIYFPPHRSVELARHLLKYLIMYVGAIDTAVSNSGYDRDPYYYYDPHWNPTHQVVLIGWDDSINFTKFRYERDGDTIMPAGGGGFLVKGWGYYYISYDDATLKDSLLAAFTAAPVTRYNRIVQIGLDLYGVSPGSLEAGMANVFSSPADDDLTAVGFYSGLPDPDTVSDLLSVYRIEVHLDPTQGPLNPTGPALAFHASFPLAGYYTVDLPRKIRLHAGQRFSVVVLGADGTWVDVYYHDGTPDSGGSSWVLLAPDEVWQPFDLERHLPIRAYTTPIGGLVSHLGTGRTADGRVTVTLRNDDMSDVTLRVAVSSRPSDDAPSPAEVSIESYRGRNGRSVRATRGLVRLSPGETVTTFTPGAIGQRSGLLTCMVYHVTSSGERLLTVAGLTVIGASLRALQVVSIAAGVSSITVTFDQDIKRGPQLWDISVTSPGEVQFVRPWISGHTLTLRATTSFASPYSSGLLWTVRIPSDAVTGTTGNRLEQDYAWSFTAGGT